MSGFHDTRGARRVDGKLVPIISIDRVLMPLVAVKASGGRSLLQIMGSVEADQGAANGKYLTADGGFTADPAEAADIRGSGGAAGASAWTPMLAPEADATRTLLKVADWIGGTGTKPAIGYLAASGIVATKAAAFNFNTAKRVAVFSALSNAQGIATVAFAPEYPAAPNVAFWAVPATALGGLIVDQVANSLTKAQVQIRVRAPALLTGVLSLLAGATVFVLAIEN